jgi:TonB family protein
MPLRKLWPLLWLFCFSSVSFARPVFDRQSSLPVREQQIWQTAVHDSKFSPIAHVSARVGCGATASPEPIATPNPLLTHDYQNSRISVSFIIGTDGRVHSPLILEGAGGTQDGNALNTVRSWRYRPATCNGVPTEAEATIEFSIR